MESNERAYGRRGDWNSVGMVEVMREGKQGRGKGVDREVAACSKVGKAVRG